MDRKLFYPGQIPLSAQFLQSEKNTMVGLSILAAAAFGSSTLVDGLSCIGATPADLTVIVGPGSIFQLANVDGTAYGSLGADVSHSIIKQGINLDSIPLTMIPPATVGQAVNYLIQAQLVETDADNVVLPYVNAANPAIPFTGPGGLGGSQPTTRKCSVLISNKGGVAATAGSQVTPTPDPGFVGLYSVSVPYGATTLNGSNIVKLDDAPFLFKKLPEIPAWVQSGEFLWGDDTGSANVIVAKLSPTPKALKKGMHVFVKKMNAANTGNVTANFNGLGAVAVLDTTGAQIGAGNLTANVVLHLVFDGSVFRWINGNVTNTTISSLTGTSGEGISVSGTAPYPISLNFAALTADTPTNLDLFPFYDNESSHHRIITWQNLLAKILAAIPATSLSSVAPMFHVEQQRLGAASPQSFGGVGVWTTRKLNTINKNQLTSLGATIDPATGILTLPAGTYRADFASVSWGAGTNYSRLFDITGNATLLRGVSTDTYPQIAAPSVGAGSFVLTVTSQIALQHISTNSNLGVMGDDSNLGGDIHIDGFLTLIKEA